VKAQGETLGMGCQTSQVL